MRNPIVIMNNLKKHAQTENYEYKRIYRNLYNEELFLLAYNKIYAKPGNMTQGADGKTIDGISLERIKDTVDQLQRRDDENDQDWNDRQWQENQYHDQMVQQIEVDVIAMFLNS